MIRILAVVAFIIAVVLFVVLAIGNPADPTSLQAWGFVSLSAGLLCLALEGVAVPTITRRQ